jgi:hypothetical protein
MLTDCLAFAACKWGAFHPVLPRLKEALARDRSLRIVDLCSGASGPLLKLGRHLYREDGTRMPILLTDKYPNLAAFEKASRSSRSALTFEASSVDAMNVPAELGGFRTLFSAFHHFSPAQAQRILQDAVDKGAGIGVFEYTERNRFWLKRALASPLLFWRTARAAQRPMNWAKALWIYVLPLPVLLFAWDSLVSCLRSYTEAELEAMTAALTGAPYAWEIGTLPSPWGGRVTYLIGLPETEAPTHHKERKKP